MALLLSHYRGPQRRVSNRAGRKSSPYDPRSRREDEDLMEIDPPSKKRSRDLEEDEDAPRARSPRTTPPTDPIPTRRLAGDAQNATSDSEQARLFKILIDAVNKKVADLWEHRFPAGSKKSSMSKEELDDFREKAAKTIVRYLLEHFCRLLPGRGKPSAPTKLGLMIDGQLVNKLCEDGYTDQFAKYLLETRVYEIIFPGARRRDALFRAGDTNFSIQNIEVRVQILKMLLAYCTPTPHYHELIRAIRQRSKEKALLGVIKNHEKTQAWKAKKSFADAGVEEAMVDTIDSMSTFTMV